MLRPLQRSGDGAEIALASEHWAQRVTPADHLYLDSDKLSLGVVDGEANASIGLLDVAKEQTSISVLMNAEQSEEGEDKGAPVSRIREEAEVEATVDGMEICQCERLFLVGDVLVAVPVEEALLELLEVCAPGERGESVCARPVCDGRDEVGHRGDLVLATPHVVRDDAAEILL